MFNAVAKLPGAGRGCRSRWLMPTSSPPSLVSFGGHGLQLDPAPAYGKAAVRHFSRATTIAATCTPFLQLAPRLSSFFSAVHRDEIIGNIDSFAFSKCPGHEIRFIGSILALICLSKCRVEWGPFGSQNKGVCLTLP